VGPTGTFYNIQRPTQLFKKNTYMQLTLNDISHYVHNNYRSIDRSAEAEFDLTFLQVTSYSAHRARANSVIH